MLCWWITIINLVRQNRKYILQQDQPHTLIFVYGERKSKQYWWRNYHSTCVRRNWEPTLDFILKGQFLSSKMMTSRIRWSMAVLFDPDLPNGSSSLYRLKHLHLQQMNGCVLGRNIWFVSWIERFTEHDNMNLVDDHEIMDYEISIHMPRQKIERFFNIRTVFRRRESG